MVGWFGREVVGRVEGGVYIHILTYVRTYIHTYIHTYLAETKVGIDLRVGGNIVGSKV